MSLVKPRINPTQLPPRTDAFTFVNLTPHPTTQADFTLKVSPAGATVGPMSLAPISPQAIGEGHAPPDFRATIVECDARVNGQPFKFVHDNDHGSSCVCHIVFGVMEEQDPAGTPIMLPFGHVTLECGHQEAL